MSKLPAAQWWTIRRASNRMPKTYRCPFCGRLLPALSEHMLIAPEGDTRRRRHAHSRCVLAARERGELPLKEDARRAAKQGDVRHPGWIKVLRRALARRSSPPEDC